MATAAHRHTILSYLGRVNIAARSVRAVYPDANLYEVHATSPVPIEGGVSGPNDLATLTCIFRAQTGHATIISASWGSFGPVQYEESPWKEDRAIEWPIEMEAMAADRALKDAGWKDNYGTMTLRHGLYPGVDEPHYIFTLMSGMDVSVGTKTGKVQVIT